MTTKKQKTNAIGQSTRSRTNLKMGKITEIEAKKRTITGISNLENSNKKILYSSGCPLLDIGHSSRSYSSNDSSELIFKILIRKLAINSSFTELNLLTLN